MRALTSEELWERRRRRMIAETETFLDSALREPYRGAVIPIYPVGRGRIPPVLSALFWKRLLFDAHG